MRTTLTSILLATLLGTTLALPTEDVKKQETALDKRGPKKGSSKNNPKKVVWDNSNWKDTSEEDCYVFLCAPQYAGEHTFQKQDSERGSRKAYTQESRASKGPFKKGGQHGGKPISSSTNSAEDAPPRSLQVNGRTRYVLPTEGSENSRQGNAIKEGYRKAEDGGAGPGEWVDVHIGGSPGPCCQAWEARDFRACTDGRCAGKKKRLFGEDIDPADFTFHTTRSGRGFSFTNSGWKRDAAEEKRGPFDDELNGRDLVAVLTEIARKRDEEDARQAKRDQVAWESGVITTEKREDIEKRDYDDDYIAAGFELDLEDLD